MLFAISVHSCLCDSSERRVQRCWSLSAASCRQASASRRLAIRFSLLDSIVSNDTAHAQWDCPPLKRVPKPVAELSVAKGGNTVQCPQGAVGSISNTSVPSAGPMILGADLGTDKLLVLADRVHRINLFVCRFGLQHIAA